MTRTRRSGTTTAIFAMLALVVGTFVMPITGYANTKAVAEAQKPVPQLAAARADLKATSAMATASKRQLPPIQLNVDSSVPESSISGITYQSSQTQAPFKFAWANRFTLAPEQMPFSLQVVGSVFFTLQDGTGFEEGEQVGIIIGLDPSASGNPINAEVVFEGTATIQNPDDFNFFQLPEPVIARQGDIYIGFVDLTTDAEPTPLPIVLPENGGVANDPRSFFRGTSTPPIPEPANLSAYGRSTTLPYQGGNLPGNFFIRGFGDLAPQGSQVSGGGQTVDPSLAGVDGLTAVGSDTVTLSWNTPPSPTADEVEPNNSAGQAQVVPFNTIINSVIKISDQGTDVGGGNFEDWFCFTLDAASEVSVEIVDDGGVDLDIFLYPKAGPFVTPIAQSAGDCGSRESFTANLNAGQYVVAVDAFDNQNCNATANTNYQLRVIGPGGKLLTRFNIYCGNSADFVADASTFIGSVASTTTALVIPKSPLGAYYRVAAVYGDERSPASAAVSGTPCEGGPTFGSIKVKRNGNGSITLKNAQGDLTGIQLQINGVGFTAPPKVKASKGKVKQKGPLANGQTLAEACPSGCTITIITSTGCSTITAP